jgi:hypothetical protein
MWIIQTNAKLSTAVASQASSAWQVCRARMAALRETSHFV